jgi:cell division septation protein DedD
VLVLVVTLDDVRRAQTVVRELSDAGLPAFWQAAPATGTQQVLVGPYVSREEAAEVQRQLIPLKFSATTIVTVQP